jgi:hypothetical protein
MKLRNSTATHLANVAMIGLLLSACSTQMQPAQQALDGASNAIDAAAADASKYAPEQLSPLVGRLTALKASFDQKDYVTVLAGAPALVANATAVQKVAAAKKQTAVQTLTVQWQGMTASIPKLIDTVKTRVNAIGKAKHAPKGVNMAAAKPALDDATVLWEKAQASFTAGNVADAVNQGTNAKAKAESAAADVQLKLKAG